MTFIGAFLQHPKSFSLPWLANLGNVHACFLGWTQVVCPQPGLRGQQQVPQALDGDHLRARFECEKISC